LTNLTWSTIYTLAGELSKSNLPTAKFEKFTKVPRERILEIITNYSNYQSWLSQYFPSVRIISVRPNTTLVEEHRMISGKELVVMAKHMVNYPQTHETFFVGGDAKGSHIVEEYEQLLQGTKITVTVDFKPTLSMKFSGMFGKIKFEDEFEKVIDELIMIAEN